MLHETDGNLTATVRKLGITLSMMTSEWPEVRKHAKAIRQEIDKAKQEADTDRWPEVARTLNLEKGNLSAASRRLGIRAQMVLARWPQTRAMMEELRETRNTRNQRLLEERNGGDSWELIGARERMTGPQVCSRVRRYAENTGQKVRESRLGGSTERAQASLRLFEAGLDYAEIAETLGYANAASARSAVTYTRKKLREAARTEPRTEESGSTAEGAQMDEDQPAGLQA